MSDEENKEFIPGPIDLTEEVKKPARKKAAKKAAKKAVKKAAAKKTKKVAEPKETASLEPVDAPVGKTKAPVKRAAAKKKTAAKRSAAKKEAQKELLFSSDDIDSKTDASASDAPVEKQSSDGEKASAPKMEGNEKASRSSEERKGSSENADGKEGVEKNRPERKDHSSKPHGNNNNRQNQNQKGKRGQHQHQNQLSNRKKKQQVWKQKQQQKKVKHSRFKIDGLNADFDNALDLGQLPEWDVLKSANALAEYLAEQPEIRADSVFNFNEVYILQLDELRDAAKATEKEFPSAPNRRQLIELILNHAIEQQSRVVVSGVLEILSDGNGMLTYGSDSYRLRALSTFVPAIFIKKFGLQRGQEVKCRMISAKEEATCPLAVEIIEAQGMEPEKVNEIVPFTEQIPYYPLDRIFLESDEQETANKVSMRVVDLISPIGFGQRGLIVAPPRTGKTILLQGMANSIQNNYPNAQLIILLIDERPEEVTDFKRRVTGGEVVSSTFDENAESHVHAAEMVIEKSRRMVEAGKDVVILLDSITRLARAYNTVMPNSGKILSGGVEANALQKPKRFFGSARNIEGGGSLTIIATALVETGSKMDEVIFEEFKGTGNMELHLDRALVDKRVFPALSMDKSGTRKEELLYHPEEIQKIYGLRRAMKGVPSADAMEMLITRVKKSGSNAEFLMTSAR